MTRDVERWVFLGATRGMGRALARLVSARGAKIFLLGRDGEELRRSARDLEARGAGAPVGSACFDLARTESARSGERAEAALDQARQSLAGFDHVVVTAGCFAERATLEAEPASLRTMLDTNFTGTIEFCEAARKQLLAQGGGRLAVFSSVAADRARRKVYLYGASKAGLSHYLEGLDHAYRSSGLITVNVKPGFVRTDMTSGLAEPPFAAGPEIVAKRVLQAIDRGRPTVYAPAIWGGIMHVIRRLPRFVLRRLEF